MRANDLELQLHQQLTTAQNKYIYFLLAAAAACVAFAVDQTNNAKISYSLIPLGLAVLSWGVSFFYGCRRALLLMSHLSSNIDFVREPASSPKTAELVDELNSRSKKIDTMGKKQFGFLVAGGFLYVVWHIIEMVLRTLSSGSPRLGGFG